MVSGMLYLMRPFLVETEESFDFKLNAGEEMGHKTFCDLIIGMQFLE